MKYRFRDKLILAFALLLIITVVPVLVLINSQIETISARKIEGDLRNTRRVFETFQGNQLAIASERTSNFILTQSEVRAEIATPSSGEDSPFDGSQPGASSGEADADPFGARDSGAGSEEPGGAPVAEADPREEEAADPFGAQDAETAAGAGEGADGAPTGRLAAPASGSGLGTRQNLLLSIVEDVALYRESDVFFITDFRGKLLFNKSHPGVHGAGLSGHPDIFAALQGNEIFTWWGSEDEAVAGMRLLPKEEGKPLLYRTFLKPVLFGREVKGLIAVGFALRDEDLRKITGITQSEIAFAANGRVYLNSKSGIPEAQLLPLVQSLDTSPSSAANAIERFEVEDEIFLALPVPVRNTRGSQVGSVIVYRSQTREKLVYENLKRVLNWIGFAALVIAGLLAYAISHNVSLAVRALFDGVAEVRQGNLEYRLDLKSRDEFGALSDAFNEMTAGLKEKEEIRDTFKRYVSSSVVDEILRNTGDIRLGGEVRSLTIQFSDIAGFTSISEGMEPEQVVEFLNEYLTEMTREIEQESGIVDKYIGDAIMAFWGTPLPVEDHASHGCRAALLQARQLSILQERWKGKAHLKNFAMRIGLHTGEVVVGNIGSDTRMDYTIIGDNVNTASRLEGMNKIYGTQILITEPTARLVEGEFLIRELDLIRAVGKSIPIRIYELAGFSEEIPPKLQEAHNRFAEGLLLYRDLRFAKAKKVFQAILKKEPDGPAETFFQRCQYYQDNPPAKDWDGVYEPEFK